jgi:hypothetical protein
MLRARNFGGLNFIKGDSEMKKQMQIFGAGFCAAICLVMLFLMVQSKPASGDDDALLKKMDAILEELTGLRKDFNDVIELTGIREVAEQRARAASSAEAANIISMLRNLKAATMMFFADSMDQFQNDGDMAIINLDNRSVERLLSPYMDNPEHVKEKYLFIATKNNNTKRWLVGRSLSDVSVDVKRVLQQKAKDVKLYDEHNKFYSGGNVVFMIAR